MRPRLPLTGLLLGSLLLATAAHAQPQPATPSTADPEILVLAAENGERLPVTATMLAQIATVSVSAQGHLYEGPSLWSVLDRAGAVPPGGREQAARAVVVSNQDGDTAVLSLPEISPLFEGKQAILASRADGQPLGPGEIDLVVPDDKSQARHLPSVTRLALIAP